jgi:hypothetical protein
VCACVGACVGACVDVDVNVDMSVEPPIAIILTNRVHRVRRLAENGPEGTSAPAGHLL